MPFQVGISVAPEIFRVYTIADDILIAGEGDTKGGYHGQKLVKLLEKCKAEGVKLNRDKLKLKMNTVPYMGHVLSDEAIKQIP